MTENHNDNREKELLFRKRSLEHLQIPDQVDQLFKPVPTYTWLIWLGLAILSLAGLLWLFLGSIPIIIEGRGIAVSPQGLFSIQSKTSGTITSILVQPGDFVEKGQLVAKVEDVQEIIKYQNAVEREQKISQELKVLRKQIRLERRAERASLLKQIEANQLAIEELSKTIPHWEQELKEKEKLFEEKLIGLHDLEDTRQNLAQNRIALETTKATLASLEANFKKMYRLQEIKEKERLLMQAQQERDIHKLYLDYGDVRSSDSGVVLEILANPGTHVLTGTPLIHVEYASEKKVPSLFYGFVSINEGKEIRKGIRVEIEPSTVNVEEYGAILGTVKEVSLFAVSREDISKLIQNENLVNYLMQGEVAVMQLTIEPLLDPTTVSGYKWTSKKGAPFQITTGTVCRIVAIANRTSPLFYFFLCGDSRN